MPWYPLIMLNVRASRRGPQLLGRARRAFAGAFGDSFSDYNSFLQSDASATYTDSTGQVYCSKDSANRPQCILQSYGSGNGGPVVAMQMATDFFLNQVPAFHLMLLANGQQLQARGADGSIGALDPSAVAGLVQNPIATKGGGYDGVVGPGTIGLAALAVSIAGSLLPYPNNVAQAFTSEQEDQFALFATDIANYLNDVTANFSALLAQYMQAYTPAPALVPAAIPLVAQSLQLQPITSPTQKKVLVGAAIGAAVLLTGAVALIARKSSETPINLFPRSY